jgi:hypothetical protein
MRVEVNYGYLIYLKKTEKSNVNVHLMSLGQDSKPATYLLRSSNSNHQTTIFGA